MRRRALLLSLRAALDALRTAGCQSVYLDGSFVTAKVEPGDYDACWGVANVQIDLLDPVFLDFSDSCSAQKSKYLGEFFPAELPEGVSGRTFLEFFQQDRSGFPKGIISVDLTSWHTTTEDNNDNQ